MKKFVVTAWTLSEGMSVWLSLDGDKRVWNSGFKDADVFDSKEDALAQIDASAADVAAFIIVDPYEITVTEDANGTWLPDGQREQIRALGEPTIPWGDDAVKHIFNPAPGQQEKAA